MADPVWTPHKRHDGPMSEAGGQYCGGYKSFGEWAYYFGMNEGNDDGTTKAQILAWLFHLITVRNVTAIRNKFNAPKRYYKTAIPQLTRISMAITAADDDDGPITPRLAGLVGTSSVDAHVKYDEDTPRHRGFLFCALLFWWLRDLRNLDTFAEAEGLPTMESLRVSLESKCRNEFDRAICKPALDRFAWSELQEWPPGLQLSKRKDHNESPLEYFNRLFEVIQAFANQAVPAKVKEFATSTKTAFTEAPPSWWHASWKEGKRDSMDSLVPLPPKKECPVLACKWKQASVHQVDPTVRDHLAALMKVMELRAFPSGGPITNPGAWTEFYGDVKRWRNMFRKTATLSQYLLGIQKITLKITNSENQAIFDKGYMMVCIYDRETGIEISIEELTERFYLEGASNAIFFVTFVPGEQEMETPELDTEALVEQLQAAME